MLSPLTRGYGSWDGMHYDPYSDHAAEEKLPFINEQEPHRHGITVGHMSRCSTSLSFKSGMAPPATPISRSEKLQRETTHNRLSRETTSVDHSSKYDLPKTYLTKKGALMLFTAPKDDQELDESYGSPKVVKTHRVKKLLDSSLKIGSLDRLAMSILQYGDEEEYDKENASISDEKKKMFIKILRKEENQRELDTRSQPGCDLNSYLRDLKFRASYRANMSGDTNIPRSREAMELRAILQGLQDNRWPIVYNTESGTFENRSSFGDQFTRPVSQQSTRTQASQGSGSTTPRSILSASKLRASLKSYSTYMGRPASDDTVKEIKSSLPRVSIRRSSAPSIGSRSADLISPGRGKRRVHSSITGGSIVEEDEEGLPLYYDPLSGMEGSSIAYTDSTDLGPHMYTFDLASGESSHFDMDSQGDGPKLSGDGSVDVAEDTNEQSDDVEVLIVEGQGSTDLASEPQSSSNQFQLVVEDQNTNTCDKSAQYELDVDSLNNSGVGIGAIPSIRIGEGVSTNNIVDMSSALSSQPDPCSESEKFDAETSTTLSEDLIEPPGVNKVDIKPISGVIPEEENVDVGFVGEGVHIPRGDDEGDELDWEERGEEAAGTEVDLARYGVIGEEDIGEGDEIDEGTEGNKTSPKVGDVHDTSLSLSPARLTKSPTSLKDQGSPERRASVARTESRASLKSQSPNLSKSQSPVLRKTSISQSNKKSPSPVQKTVSPIQTPQKTVVNEISKQIPSPEIRGKNTPPSVTITKKLSSQNLPNVTNDADTPDTQKTNKMPVGPSDKDNSLQGPKDIKHEGPKDGLPLAPASSPVPKELDAPDTQKAQAMDEGAPEKELKAVADKSEKEDEDKETSPDLSISPVEDKDKKKQLQTNEDKEKPKGLDGAGGADPSISTKVEAPAPPKLVDQMPVIPDYLKPKPQKTPKTKEKKARKQPAPKTKKDVTKAMSVASIQPEADTASKAESVAKVWDHQKVEIPPEKDELVIPDHMKEAFDRDTEQSRAALEQQMKQNHRKARKTNGVASIVDDTLNHTIDENYLETGLTEEELLEAKMAVEEKLLVAQAKIEEMEKTGTIEDSKNSDEKQKAVTVKEGKGKKKGGKGNSATKDSSAKRQAKVEKDLQAQKILKKEQKRIEEKKKLEEKRKLEDEIMARQELVEEHEQRTRDKELKRGKAAKKELKLEMERLRREEMEMQEAVDEVHQYLAESRKRQREERDQRRKADQERRRDLAREKFEQDKKKREEESKKVMEELDRIHDLEMRKQKKLEEEMKREEEERIALEQAEEEEKERVRAEEDQERRVREIEVQMEEEEMQRLYNQEQEISRQRILLEMEREKMAEEEENKRQELLAEQMKYEEIKRKQEEEELRVLDEQRRRLQELKDMEEAAKLKLQQDLEERRAKALARREENLENRANMDKLKHSQGITKSWVFSYFVRWPLESYMVPMGVDETKKKGFRPRPKTAK
ncbi:calponin homology domain-containing protein DDB_G0272472-like isoform X2 [Crassostrea angulata]|uniref:calponin homology domain-containing protein DDB_G0272472-like isoform X2 n=1 Tax=Magallana angulata TaxID=2784310 RepID=UPI0022B143E9|nr:calponin homology domain-containing protein DDB_G0272472-like isoform X2 [Crassostrea angulata]